MASFINPDKAQNHRLNNILLNLDDRTKLIDDANNRHASENILILEDIQEIIGKLKSAITQETGGMRQQANHPYVFKNLK